MMKVFDECPIKSLKFKRFLNQTDVRLWIFILILTVVASEVSVGQVKRVGVPGISSYSKSDYRGGTQNWAIAQDSNRFMYFANNNGVLRFDGIHWDLIEVSKSAAVRSIHIDASNRIYVGLYNDFGIIEKLEGGPYQYRSLRHLLPPGIRQFDEIWKIHSTPEGILFQSFDYIFCLRDDRIMVIEPENRYHFSFEVGGKIFVNEPESGLYELVKGKKKLPGWSDVLVGKEVWGMAAGSNNRLLIGTNTSGLYELNNGRLQKWDTPAGRLVEKYQLYSMVPLGDDYVAFGTILNGLVVADLQGEIIQNLNVSNGLQNNTVLSVFADNNQNLWLGLDNGIDYVNINSPVSYSNSNENIGTGYTSIIHNEKLYLGTNQGLYVKSFGAESPVEEGFKLVENTVGQVWSLDVFDGDLICGHNSGIFLVEGERAERIGNEEGVWRFIRHSKDSDILLGGSYNGLLTLSNESGEWKVRGTIKGFNESSRFLAQDENGVTWVSHGSKGVFRLDLNESLDSVTDLRLYNSRNGLPSSEQNILFKFREQVYLSTVDGIYRYNRENDTFVPAGELNGFQINGQLKTIEEDNDGNYWFIAGGESGVFLLNEDRTYTKIILPFRQLDEHYVNGFEFIYPYKKEHVLFGTDLGFAHYSGDYNKQFDQPFKAFITKVEATYLDSIVYLPDQDHVSGSFPYDKNSFTFHYTAPFYEHQDKTEFSYKLENFQDEWSSWSDVNYKEFTNLPHGNYKFVLKARNIYGVESNVAVFGFSVLPPWYSSDLARAIYLLLFIGAILIVLKLVQRKIENTKKRVIQNHKAELKLKEEKYQLQNLMTEKEIIKLRNEKLESEMIYRNKELANQTMGIIQKNKFLVGVKTELQKINKTVDEEIIRKRLADLTRKINKEIDNKQQHQLFETYFEEVHDDFFKSLKEQFPDLTPREMRLCAYIKMNLTSKEIAALLNISDRGVEISRYRLRKKLQLQRDVNLSTFLSNI